MDEIPCSGCGERDARIAFLEERVADLEARLRDLTQPPGQTRPAAALPPGPPKKATGKRRGAQPGHPPHLKKLVAPERVNETVIFVPEVCEHCQASLLDASCEGLEPTRHQVAELPKLLAHITEYQGQARTCSCCGEVTRATIPAEIRAHSVGPRLTGVLSYFTGAQGISKRAVEEISTTIFDADIALGTVSNLEQEVCAALEPIYQEALEAVRAAAVKNVDETGWKEAGRKRWLWVAATATVVVFMIQRLRNAVALRKLLGPTLAGIIGSDRAKAYNSVPILRRQLCWAHLKRNWEKLQELGGKAKVIAEALLCVHKQVFELWHLFRGGGCTRSELDEQMVTVMLAMLDILDEGARCRDAKTKRHCANLRAVFPGLWTFVAVEGVEPTNNHAERVLRRPVLWRRRSFGCDSANGCRFAERILTVVQSLRLQKRNAIEFLDQTITAHRSSQKGPKLVLKG